MKGYHIAVVGATGAAGTELLRVLERRNFPVANLRALASARSAGKSLRFRGESVPVEKLADRSFDKTDIAFFCTDGDVSKKYVPIVSQAEAIGVIRLRPAPQRRGYGGQVALGYSFSSSDRV